jgi:hypothetical protein
MRFLHPYGMSRRLFRNVSTHVANNAASLPEDPNPDLAPFVLIKIGNTIFWDESPCNLVDGYKFLGGISYLHFNVRIYCPENGGNRFLPVVVTLYIYQAT